MQSLMFPYVLLIPCYCDSDASLVSVIISDILIMRSSTPLVFSDIRLLGRVCVATVESSRFPRRDRPVRLLNLRVERVREFPPVFTPVFLARISGTWSCVRVCVLNAGIDPSSVRFVVFTFTFYTVDVSFSR